ncbi:hypothetical protein DD630_29105 [Streptomyces sp. BSE7F]|nr:hypothetical protein DD630_29105 [Streptomyces sp. BSE7F]
MSEPYPGRRSGRSAAFPIICLTSQQVTRSRTPCEPDRAHDRIENGQLQSPCLPSTSPSS